MKITTDNNPGQQSSQLSRIGILVLALGLGGCSTPEGASDWINLFNGRDLTGWRENRFAHDPHWEVKDGILIGKGGQGYLASEREFGDFELIAEVRVWDTGTARGNSGVYFRCQPHADLKQEYPPGYEAQCDHLDQNNPTGSIYSLGVPGARAPMPGVKDGEWFNLRIVAEGNHLRTWVNGQASADCFDPQNRYRQGYILLQMHHHTGVVEFRSIRVRPLSRASGVLDPVPPLPTPEQRAWQEGELTMFVHFGVNTFTDREWGDGKEDPRLFNPTRLDARQWVRAAKSAGFKLVILTAKHHDGFCLWPSKFTEHSVKKSPWKNGQGDVVREFTDACRAEGVKIGLYLSPWDRHEQTYGTDAYNTYFTNQLTELLTQYGTIDEVWFDGACGEGPNGKKQVYDWPAFYGTIRALAPKALIAINGPDVRWVGNEDGLAQEGESSVKPAGQFHPGQNGLIWHPAECDVSIRPGWFYHGSEDAKVKSLDHLLDLYFKSVGRNSVLLVNVPPNREGLFAEVDVNRLREFGEARREIFGRKIAGFTHEPGRDDFRPVPVSADGTATLELNLDPAKPFNIVSLREPFWLGERSEAYRVETFHNGQWKTIAKGTVIGSRNLLRLPETSASKLRIVIERFRGAPALTEFAIFHTTRFNPVTSSF